MANVLRTLVSKKKRRYKDEHFDLDLTCMCAIHSLIHSFIYVLYLYLLIL